MPKEESSGFEYVRKDRVSKLLKMLKKHIGSIIEQSGASTEEGWRDFPEEKKLIEELEEIEGR
jgi:hypothetical protein